MTAEGVCAACGEHLRLERVGFRELCPHCDAELHACIQCRHYAPGKPHDCNEPNIEPVRDKERNNRCDWFQFGGGSGGDTGLSKDQAEQMLKDLFK